MCDRLPPERVVPLDVAVEWYALVLDHRPVSSRALPGPARRGDRPAARFATTGAWRSAAWAAEADRARVDDLANVTLAGPQVVK